jgi:hypothetical protein
MSRLWGSIVSVALAAGAHFACAPAALADPHDALVRKHATANGVPEALVRRVIHIESRGNPRAVSKGNYGLMQIRLGTARSMGYSGDAGGLLDADTNMTYAVRYLANAYRAAGCNIGRAIAYYQRGFYKKPQMRCGSSAPSRAAEAQTNALEANDRTASGAKLAAASMRSADVLKPRVVHIEKITRSAHDTMPHQVAVAKQPRSAFDPVRVARTPAETTVASIDPTAEPAAAIMPMPVPRPMPPAKAGPAAMTSGSSSAIAQPAEAEQIAALDSQSIPMPPTRPDITPTPETKPARRAAHRNARHARSKAEETPGVVSFLQKLGTPDKREKKLRKAKAKPQTITPYAAPIY